MIAHLRTALHGGNPRAAIAMLILTPAAILLLALAGYLA